MPATRIPAFGERGREFLRSRGLAAAVVLGVHVAFLLLLTGSLRRIVLPTSPSLPPLLILLQDSTRAVQRPDRHAFTPHFLTPTVRLADPPPDVRLEMPVATPPAPIAS